MIDLRELGWEPATIGELDHRLLMAPSIKLRSAFPGQAGDIVYRVDLRLRRPNAHESISIPALHSLEHFLLEGFRARLPEHFVGVGVMGCQTGFYLTLLNEGRRKTIENTLESVLERVVVARVVPYARVDQCGNWRNHDLGKAQAIAHEALTHRSAWGDVT